MALKFDGVFLLKLIGSGGYSEVYSAEFNSQTQFAVKCLTQYHGSQSSDESLQREIGFLSRVKLGQVPLFYSQIQVLKDSITEHRFVSNRNGESFNKINCLIIQRIVGPTLDNMIYINELEKLKVMCDLANLVYIIHEFGIVHRDLKPNNLILCKSTGKLYLLDFGISKSIEATVTSSNPRLGTIQYFPPEYCPGDEKVKINKKSDVWALGLIINEIFSGEKPWSEKKYQSPFQILGFLYNRTPFIVHSSIENEDVRAIIRACTEYEVDKRLCSSQLLLYSMFSLFNYLASLKPNFRNATNWKSHYLVLIKCKNMLENFKESIKASLDSNFLNKKKTGSFELKLQTSKALKCKSNFLLPFFYITKFSKLLVIVGDTEVSWVELSIGNSAIIKPKSIKSDVKMSQAFPLNYVSQISGVPTVLLQHSNFSISVFQMIDNFSVLLIPLWLSSLSGLAGDAIINYYYQASDFFLIQQSADQFKFSLVQVAKDCQGSIYEVSQSTHEVQVVLSEFELIKIATSLADNASMLILANLMNKKSHMFIKIYKVNLQGIVAQESICSPYFEKRDLDSCYYGINLIGMDAAVATESNILYVYYFLREVILTYSLSENVRNLTLSEFKFDNCLFMVVHDKSVTLKIFCLDNDLKEFNIVKKNGYIIKGVITDSPPQVNITELAIAYELHNPSENMSNLVLFDIKNK